MTAAITLDAGTCRRSPTGARSPPARACGSTRPRCRRSRRARAAVDAIIARGEPVYGINTGFGKLASVRIAADDLAALQRNIVLSHAAGVGEPMRPAIVRLMMALKLASLGRGASGVRPATVDHARSHAGARRHPGDPEPGLGRRVRRSRAARAHGGRDARRRRGLARRRAHAGRRPRSRAPASRRSCSGRRKGSRCSTAPSSRPPRRWRACSRSSACSRRRWSPARCRPTPPRAPTRRSMRASTRCAAIAARSRWRRPCAR